MTAQEIIKLIDAGFTKDEIFKLDADVKVVPGSKIAEGKKETVPEDPKPADPKTDPAPAPSGITLSDDQFTKLMQQLNVNGASLDVPPETDIATKLGDHFKDLMVGK